MNTITVPGLSVAFMAASCAFAFVLPAVLYIVLRKKLKARFVPLLIGAATFIVAALVAESAVHSVILGDGNILSFLKANPLLYALYGGLMAGLFEESGRFASFKLMRKKYNESADALSFGVGHGGAEAILTLGVGMISSIVISVIFNSGGADTMLASLPEAQKQTLLAQGEALAATPPGMFLVGIVERTGAVAFHIGASVLVYLAATGRGSFLYYPLAALLHLLLDIPAGLYQAGALNDIWVIEAIVVVFSALTLWFAVARLKEADRRLKGTALEN